MFFDADIPVLFNTIIGLLILMLGAIGISLCFNQLDDNEPFSYPYYPSNPWWVNLGLLVVGAILAFTGIGILTPEISVSLPGTVMVVIGGILVLYQLMHYTIEYRVSCLNVIPGIAGTFILTGGIILFVFLD